MLNACDNGGMVTMELGPLMERQVSAIQWAFDAPPGTSVAALRLWRHASVLWDDQQARYRAYAGTRTLEASPETVPWAFGNFEATDELTATDLDVHTVGVEFGCHEEWEDCIGDAAHLRISRAAVTLRDQVAPQLSGLPAGRLVAGRSLDGIVDLRLGFGDVGGGVEAVEFRVDGLIRSVTQVGGPTCLKPYVVTTPCASEGHVTLMLDTDELTDGPHTAEAVLMDVAGNRTTVGPFGVSVRTPTVSPVLAPPLPAPPAGPSTSAQPGVLSLTGARTRRTSYKAATLKGAVKASTGAALGGARVAFATRPLNSSTWSDPTVTTADAKGRFSICNSAGAFARGPGVLRRVG